MKATNSFLREVQKSAGYYAILHYTKLTEHYGPVHLHFPVTEDSLAIWRKTLENNPIISNIWEELL